MPFVPGYAQDVFVSYAHVDDQPYPGGAQSGWVSTLVETLHNELARKTGRRESFKIWRDSSSLRGHHALTDEIAAQVEGSATFLAILSTG